MAYIPPVKAGDLITEGLLNRIVDQIERFASLKSGSPYIRLEDGPHGKLIELDLPQQTWALLSGSTSPYSWTEVRDGPSGTWTAVPSGDSGTANCYEANGKSGLAGKVVPITWTVAGDWRFQWIGVGNAPCGWRFTINGCAGTGVEGATIELRQSGMLIDSGVTDSSGICLLTPPLGTYSVTVIGPSGAGFASNVATRAFTCPVSGNRLITISLTADSDHVCWSCCNYPLPKEIHSTDSDGPITLTWDPTSGAGTPRYTLAATTEVSSACENTGSGCFNCVSPGTVTKNYTLTFQGNCTVILGIGSSVTCCDFGASFWIGGPTSAIATPFDGVYDCDPLMVTVTVPTTFLTPGCGAPGATLPTPGGGGLLVFTP